MRFFCLNTTSSCIIALMLLAKASESAELLFKSTSSEDEDRGFMDHFDEDERDLINYDERDITNYDERDLVTFNPYQVDPKITRPQIVSAHTKWLYCSSAFWVQEGKCETRQKFVPDGYFFETGRPTKEGTKCNKLTGNGDVPVVTNCNVKKGVRMVLPVVNYIWYGCVDGIEEDPRNAPGELSRLLPQIKVHKAHLDGKPIGHFNSIKIMTQDGDMDSRLSNDAACNDYNGLLPLYKNCPLAAAGHYVFINTNLLAKGKHELLLIGETGSGFCSAVKHKFTIL